MVLASLGGSLRMGRKKKKGKGAAPKGGGTLPPLPLPPPPGGIALPPPPPLGGVPPPPSLPPLATESEEKPERGALDAAKAPTISSLAPPDMSSKKDDRGYDSLWERGSSKPLQQVYGHIDRLGEGEVGSLLERYADRFGHQLDREIIVKRKAEHDSRVAEVRDAPTITMLDEDEEEYEDEELEEIYVPDEEVEEEADDEEDDVEEIALDLDESVIADLEKQKSNLVSSINKLKPKYKLAKQRNQKSKLNKLKPQLEALISEHKAIKAVLSGEADISTLIEEEIEDEEDIFLDFTGVVDNLLLKLPDVDAFIASDSFQLYSDVAGDPAAADVEARSAFFNLVDSMLMDIPDDEILAFTKSEDFAIYSEVGAIYGS
jgi:hypothetical protein